MKKNVKRALEKSKDIEITLPKELGKVRKIIKAGAALAVMAMTVYTLVPKNEKIEGITETGFITKK